MTVVMMDKTKISWEAVARVADHYREEFGPQFSREHYQDWMLHTWGIDHRRTYINVMDEQKYTMFLLRFA